VIAFGVSVTEPEVYERCAEPGIRLVAEPDTEILAHGSTGSVFRSYNMLMDQAKKLEGLEALVLIHQDAEIIDPDFLKKIREALSDPDVAIVGCAGAIGVRNIAWWDGSVTWASFTHRYEELGGGEVPALAWTPEETPTYAQTGEVETVDGFVLGLTPWALEELRFDESLGQAIHGYDFDLCLQAREKGKKVVTADLKVVHHHDLKLIRDVGNWIEAHIKVAEKWDGRMPLVGQEGDPEDWKARARRAEAQASAERMIALSARLYRDARIEHLMRQRQRIEEDVEKLRESRNRLVAQLNAIQRRRRRFRRLVKAPFRIASGYLHRRQSGDPIAGKLEDS
jgi:Glycosyltransferase like family